MNGRARLALCAATATLSVPRGGPLNALWQQADPERSGLATMSAEATR
jgi:hypothetical protein